MIKQVLAAAFLFGASLAANAAFVTSNSAGDNGTVVVNSATPTSGQITIIGSDGGSGNSFVSYTDTAATALNVTFTWKYFTFDVDGPTFDPFGFTNNGTLFTLTNNAGPDLQQGSATFSVAAGSVFGWYINSTDNIAGNSTVGVQYSITSAVPEPESVALLMAGLGLVGFSVRKAKK